MAFSSSNPSHHTDTFFDFLVKLLYFPTAFPQELVPSNVSVLCTQQPGVRAGIKHEIMGMLGGNPNLDNITKMCRQVVSAKLRNAKPEEVVLKFWSVYLEEVVSFDEDPEDWEENWLSSKRTWESLYRVFTSDEGWKYAVLFGRLSKGLVHLSNFLPEHSEYPGDTSLIRRTALEPVVLAFRTALKHASDDSPTSTNPSRRSPALLGLAISLFRISFVLEKPQLCPQIMQLIKPHLPSFESAQGGSEAGGRVFGLADVVEFRFLVGQWCLGRRAIREAHKEFRIAFDLCSTQASPTNRRSILIRLLTTSLLLGLLPSDALLDAFDLTAQFQPLVQGILHGDMPAWKAGLGLDGDANDGGLGRERAEWFRTRGILGVLREKGEVLVWRGLLRRTLLVHRQLASRTPGVEPNSSLPISRFLTALRFSMKDNWLELDDAEAICVSLIDQGFIKAYIAHSSRTLVFAKADDMGFPPVARIRKA